MLTVKEAQAQLERVALRYGVNPTQRLQRVLAATAKLYAEAKVREAREAERESPRQMELREARARCRARST